jgi:heme oxygenase (biliverdin-producing, ferredoxin)
MSDRLSESAPFSLSVTVNLDPWSTLMNAAAVPTAEWQLSTAMRAASQKEHDAAEQSPFVAELLGGGLGREAYVAYLLRLRGVYSALEEAFRRRRQDPIVAAFYDPDLERLPAIAADLECWSDDLPASFDSAATESYRDRLAALDSGAGLLAHHYTRYLGDLSGGQVISRVLDREFQLGGVGLALYSFPMQPKRYKDSYRARLDALTLQPEEIETLLSEVKLAFRLNQALLDELGDLFSVSTSREP